MRVVTGELALAEWEAQTAGCKMGSRMYCTAWEIQPIFGNNCKWKVTFQHHVTEFLKIRNDILIYKVDGP